MTPDPIHSPSAVHAESALRDKEIGPEDVNRKPGGFPHRLIAVTALLVILTVGLLFIALRGGSIAAFVMIAFAMVVGIPLLGRESTRERDHIHPSR